MSGNKITGLPVATSNGEAVEFSQLQTAVNDKAPTTEGIAEANKNLVCDNNTSITGLASLGVAGCNLTEVAGSGGADYELKLYNDSITNSGTTTGLSPVVHQGATRNTSVTAGNNWYPSDGNVWQLANSEVPIAPPHYEMLDFNLKATGIGLNRNFPLKRPNQSKVLFTTGTSYHGGVDDLLHLTGTETINSGVQLVGFDCRNMEAYVSFQSHSYSFWTQFLADDQPFEIGGADYNNFNQLAAVYISISRNSFKFRIGGTAVQEYTTVDPIGTLGEWVHWAVSNDRSNGNVSNVTIFRNGSIYATFTDPGWNFDAGAFDSPIIFGNMHPEMKIAGIRAWRGTTIDANFIATLWNERYNTGVYDLTVNGSLILPPLQDIGTIDPNGSEFAVETWVKDTGVAGIETLFAWHEDPYSYDNNLTEIRIDRTTPSTPVLALRKYTTGGTTAPPTYQYTSAGNGWDHIVISFTGGNCYFYVNNQTAHTFTWSDSNHHGGRFRIGSRPLTALAPTHSTAQIGRVLMFNSHLTASQVSDLYAHRLMTTPGFPTSLAIDKNLDMQGKTLVNAVIQLNGLDAGGGKIVNVADGTASQDCVNFSQLTTTNTNVTTAQSTADGKLSLTGGTLTGALAMSNNKITGLSAGTTNGDSVRYEELQSVSTVANNALPKAGGTMTGQLVLGNHLACAGYQLTNIAEATGGGDALQFNQANNTFVKLTGSTMTGNLSHDNASDFQITGGSGKNVHLVTDGAGKCGLSSSTGTCEMISGKSQPGAIKIQYTNSSGSLDLMGSDNANKLTINDNLLALSRPIQLANYSTAGLPVAPADGQLVYDNTTLSIKASLASAWYSLESLHPYPSITVVKGTVENIASGAGKDLIFNSSLVNRAFTWSANSTTVTVPRAGLYQVSFTVSNNTTPGLGGDYTLTAYAKCSNNVDYTAGRRFGIAKAQHVTRSMGSTCMISLRASDTVSVYLVHDHNSAVAVGGSGDLECMLSVTYVSQKI